MNESNGTCECTVWKDRSLAYCTIDARSLAFTSSKQVTVQILGFTRVIFSIYFASLDVLRLFCFIFSASIILYYFVSFSQQILPFFDLSF